MYIIANNQNLLTVFMEFSFKTSIFVTDHDEFYLQRNKFLIRIEYFFLSSGHDW